MSLYNEENLPLEKDFAEKLKFDSITDFDKAESPAFRDVVVESLKYVDVVIKGDEFLDADLNQAFTDTKTQKSEYLDSQSIENIY